MTNNFNTSLNEQSKNCNKTSHLKIVNQQKVIGKIGFFNWQGELYGSVNIYIEYENWDRCTHKINSNQFSWDKKALQCDPKQPSVQVFAHRVIQNDRAELVTYTVCHTAPW